MVIQLLRKKRKDTYPKGVAFTTRNHGYTILALLLSRARDTYRIPFFGIGILFFLQGRDTRRNNNSNHDCAPRNNYCAKRNHDSKE